MALPRRFTRLDLETAHLVLGEGLREPSRQAPLLANDSEIWGLVRFINTWTWAWSAASPFRHVLNWDWPRIISPPGPRTVLGETCKPSCSDWLMTDLIKQLARPQPKNVEQSLSKDVDVLMDFLLMRQGCVQGRPSQVACT